MLPSGKFLWLRLPKAGIDNGLFDIFLFFHGDRRRNYFFSGDKKKDLKKNR